MASDLFNQINGGGFNPTQFMRELQNLKSQGGDPNAMIQNLLNSGRVSLHCSAHRDEARPRSSGS